MQQDDLKFINELVVRELIYFYFKHLGLNAQSNNITNLFNWLFESKDSNNFKM